MPDLRPAALAALLVAVPQAAGVAGKLNIFNGGDYTSPELIEKFEQQYEVEVTITDYDSNDTALAKVKAGGNGFDPGFPRWIGVRAASCTSFRWWAKALRRIGWPSPDGRDG
jgi:spermidine/putrescine-binding protein